MENPHSVIFIDEPELHLHPTLTFRLLETLKSLGEGTNQLILFTHSADLISTYFSVGNVFFIDLSESAGNQARQLSDLTKAHVATARAVGANLGLFAVGKHLVFIEGQQSSTDRAVYHRVAQRAFPDAYLLPLGSVDNLMALRTVVAELDHAVFGIGLSMLRDRDGLPDATVADLQSNPRFRCLPRRHIENYLLDEDVLSEVASQFYLDPQKRDKTRIVEALNKAATDSLMVALLSGTREWIRMNGILSQPTVKNVQALTLEQFIKEVSTSVHQAREVLNSSFEDASISAFAEAEHARLAASLRDNSWRVLFPGKLVFALFCGHFWSHDAGRVREAYADIAFSSKPSVFEDVTNIFTHFRGL